MYIDLHIARERADEEEARRAEEIASQVPVQWQTALAALTRAAATANDELKRKGRPDSFHFQPMMIVEIAAYEHTRGKIAHYGPNSELISETDCRVRLDCTAMVKHPYIEAEPIPLQKLSQTMWEHILADIYRCDHRLDHL